MKYFENLPDIILNGYNIKDINQNIIITDVSDEYISTYRLAEGETLHDVAYELYKDTSLWWVLAILNKIVDPIFDLPLEEISLQRVTYDLAVTEYQTNGGTFNDIYLTIYDTQSEINDAKRIIKVIKTNYIQTIIRNLIKAMNS